MTKKQIAILNSLVTFAAENIPGELSEEEHEVSRIVARWVLNGAHKTHNYLTVNTSFQGGIEKTANFWADMGWRVVGVTSPYKPGYAAELVLERPVEISHPDDPVMMR